MLVFQYYLVFKDFIFLVPSNFSISNENHTAITGLTVKMFENKIHVFCNYFNQTRTYY